MSDINQKIYDIATGGAASQATKEANGDPKNGSQLPGRENGPADAYRHILLAAELTRKYGEDYARKLLDGHEWTGNNDGQTKSAESMDRHNNEIGIDIGNRLRRSGGRWEDVVREAREKIDPDKNGEPDSGKWLPPEDWRKNPIDDDTGQRMSNDDPRLKLPPEWSGDPLNPDSNDDDLDYSLPDRPYYDPPGNIKKKTQTASSFASPIVLDLDGDGVIRTIGLSPGVNFDHAADGFAERTGWVAPGDGLLVWDRNANGTIDSGRELLGSETVLPNGLKALNGFEALKAFDANDDGVIDANDPVYAQLRVWVDGNTDGRNAEGELLTLEEAGVKSINLAYTNSSYVDAQGNAHKQVGSYTTTDDQTRAATDVWFTSDVTYSTPTEWVDVPDDIAVLPDAQGYGRVRDLHQAMAMDATGELKAMVVAFTQTDTREDRVALVRQIIYRWTGVQNVNPTSRTNAGWGNAIGDARKLEALEEFLGQEWRQYTWGANPGRDAARTLNEAYDQLEALVCGQLMSQSRQKDLFLQVSYRWDAETETVLGDLSAVAQTLATRIDSAREAGLADLSDFLHSLKGMGLLNQLDVMGFKAALLPLGTDVADTLDKALQGWVEANGPTEGSDVLRGSNFDDFLDARGGDDRLLGRAGNDMLLGGTGNDVLDGGAGNDVLLGGAGNDALDGGADNDELRGGIGSDTYRFGRGDGHDTIITDSWRRDETDRIELKAGVTPSDVRLERVRTVNGWQIGDELKITIRDTGETLTVKNHFNESRRFAVEEIAFADGTLWDVEAIKSRSLRGEAGDDVLRGFNGRGDVIEGGAGNDNLSSLSGDDVLGGGDGNDELYGGDGNDVLVGGQGKDVLEGGTDSDTYRFGLGDGQDVIVEGDTAGEDALELAAGITPLDVTVRWTLQGDMAVTLPDGSRLTVRGQANTWSSEWGVEQLRFADGTVWDRSELALRALAATAGDDAIIGGHQDDTLDGGAGNDRFQNLGGHDTYRFGTGDGQDVIEASDGRILFKPGIGQNDVRFALDGKDLIATITASGDAVRIKDWLNSWQRIDRFDFDNGASLNESDVLAKLNVSEGAEILYGSPRNDALVGTEKDSTLYGGEGNDVLEGGAGNDRLYGDAGDDTLDGGANRDWLYGGKGNNRYRVATGMGLDHAMGASLAVANDTVVFAPGIRPEDVSVQLGDASGLGQQPGDVGYHSLVIGIGGNDALAVHANNWDDLGRGALQHFRFDDGTEWTLADVIARADGGKMGWQQRDWGNSSLLVGSQADDDITDYTGQSVTVQARGNDDNVYLEAGNDRVSAGSGDDNVYSGAGEDVVAGEAGNDNLNTGAGDDVVVFNHGDGNDTLLAGEGTDTLSFGATVLPAMLSAALDRDGRVMLLVEGGAGGSITLNGARIDDLPGDLERLQFIDADGKTRVFDLAGWLKAKAGTLLSATTDVPLAFDGTGFELTGTVAPVGGLEAVAYAQSGDLFAPANLANNTPTEGDDVLYGTPNGETLDAGAGNDMALGLAGNDTIQGGDGNDLIQGGDGDDVLEGNAGNDVVYGGWGADQLTGGTGHDQLFGEWGGDTYVYQSGQGEVVIDDDHRVLNGPGTGGEDVGLAGSNGNWGSGVNSDASVDDAPNILTFGPGIRQEDLRYSERNGDWVIEFANHPGDRVILRGYEPNRATKTRSVDVIRFADGTEIVAESIEPTGKTETAGDEGGLLDGTPFADTLIGGDGDDVLEGYGGADRLVGGAGSDTYRIHKEWGTRPTETLIAETWREQDENRIELTGDVYPGALRLVFDGHDLLLRLNGIGDAIRFVNFDPRLSGMQAPVTEIALPDWDMTLSFDELLARGIRYGDHTQDIYDIKIGDGEVFIDEVAAPDAGNVLRFGPGIDPESLRTNLRFEEDDNGGHVVLISYGNDGDVVRLTGFDPDDVLGTRAVDRFEFADGTVWDYATLVANGFSVIGDEASNDIGGSQLADRLYGHAGDDVIDGKSGINEFHGGGGNDTLIGGDQVDGYFFQHGDGVDTIIDGPSDNFIVFGAGVSRTDITVAWDNDTLVLRYGPSDEIRIPDFYAKTSNGTPPVTAIRFDDGEMASIPSLISASSTVQMEASELPVATEDAAYRHSIVLSNFDQAGAFGAARMLNLRQADGSPLPGWLTFDAERGLLRGTPVNEDVGQLSLIVEAWNDYGLLATQRLRLSVNNTNDAPEAGTPLSDLRALEDSAFRFTLPAGSFRDVDVGDVLTYTATLANGDPLPAWLTLDAQTGTFYGTPANGDVGELRLAVTATDLAGASASQVFALEVTNTNDAPTVGSALAALTATEDTAFTYTLPTGAFADADVGDRLSYSATLADGSALPAWLSFDAATGTFSGTPGNDNVGAVEIRVTASDLVGAAVGQSFSLTVANTNDAPEVAVALTNQQATEDAPFAFTVPQDAFRDVDTGDAITLSATRADGAALPTWLQFDSATRSFSGTPANGDVGSVSVRLTASDAAGASVNQTFAIGVSNVNDAPEVGTLLTNQTGRAGTPLRWQLPGTAFVDVDAGDVLAYSATLADGSALPAWLAFDAATGSFSGTPVTAGNYALRVTATDQADAQASQRFTLTVESGSANQAPIATADAANVIEDRQLKAWGNVLANDRDPEGARLSVANPGIRRGEYGVLTLLSNGAYAYVLDDCSSKVQGLGAGETVTETFGYLASDGTQPSNSALTVTVQGINDAPELVRCLSDVQLAKGKFFSWQMPAGSFKDADRNDTLSYTATLSNGKALPSWLKFDAATQTFSGTAPANAKGSIDVRVTASDGHGECSTASDDFKVSFGNKTVVPTASKGNEGVGNGLDAPPPGHDTNINDGAGSSPGQPGRKHRGDHDDDPLGRFLDGFKRDDKSAQSPHSALLVLDRRRFEQWGEQEPASGLARASHAVERHWAELTHALNRLDAERQSAPAWSHANQGADLSGLSGWMQGGAHGASGGVDAVSLACGTGTQLKGLLGLREGVTHLTW